MTDSTAISVLIYLGIVGGLVAFMIAGSVMLGPAAGRPSRTSRSNAASATFSHSRAVSPSSSTWSPCSFCCSTWRSPSHIPGPPFFKKLGVFGLVEMGVFLGVVIAGLVSPGKKGAAMGLKQVVTRVFGDDSFITTKLDAAIGWSRKYSLFMYPFVTACCGMEYMSVSSSHYDLDRFGAAFPRFSPARPACHRRGHHSTRSRPCSPGSTNR